MTKFVMRNGHPVSVERAAILDALVAGEEPQPIPAKPVENIEKHTIRRVASTPGPASNKARKAQRDAQALIDAETTSDGKEKPVRKIKALLPKNVDHEGKVIDDEETLAKIAADTAAIEAARVAASEASAGSDETVTTEVLGTGDPVDEEDELPSGDARIEGTDASV